MKRSHSIPAVLLLFVLAGCRTGYYHTQTTWHEDGSVERAILQPAKDSQSEVSWDNSWSTSERSFDFDGDIRKIKPVEDGSYFAAYGKVDSWNRLPRHYLKEGPNSEFKSTFERDAKTTDYGLVIEYSWKETLTDVVRLSDGRKALGEGAELAGRYLQFVYDQALGGEYDASRLNKWVTTEGRAWAEEFFDVLYEAALRGVDVRGGGARAELARVCRDHGLSVTLKEADKDRDEIELRRFLIQLCRKTIRKSNGDEIEARLVESIVAAIIKNQDTEEPDVEKLKRDSESASEEFERSWPDGPEALHSFRDGILVRIFGLHGFPLSSPEEFRFQMAIPGEIIETNGRLVRDGRVQWTFSGTQAWPSGHSMNVRSLAPASEAIGLLAGKSFKPTRENLTRIIDIVAADEPLLAAIQKCRKEGSPKPLIAYHEEVSGNGESLARLLLLLKLLESPITSGR